ncbi:hypothetical protein Belba_2916 [Belliella baltica DSM 15883]|uniref:VLRF1 domain-containing protein n=1 Tax=Belliella baltica (strain DSM 15883 / CIP 108006 / LMG 21964 / BA134) TaxID=866536 RepID=I3Z878_BELBD|nr:hypothetical protein [Belliella baltica]AFL85446.1 hypothetical protein Belba_2916 [Belliella baltica DSM 15883]
MKIEKFDKRLIFRFVTFMQSQGIAYEYNNKKHLLNFLKNKESILKLRLPLDIDFDQNKNLLFESDFKNYVLIMIRSGIASVGFFENYINHQHKVFRAYMTRKKQGKSQIKHLKTKGKSRAGSRIRLQETLEFFESINHRLQDHFDEFRIDKIGISCSETLIPYFYGGKVSTPFEKHDKRIFKIPKHIQNPTFEELTEINKFLLQAEIRATEDGQGLYQAFLQEVNDSTSHSSEENEEDW